jgi:hypothetical protein
MIKNEKKCFVISQLVIVTYVRKPVLANVKDVSNPIPLELPVTTATI